MTLKIYLLGQFKLANDEQPLDLPSRPAQSLLAYLVLNPGFAHRREKLAGLLWPDSTETNARNYLRQALWRIRKALEDGSLRWEDFLDINKISVASNPNADCWLDTNDILKKDVTSGELADILEHYQGELLPGFYDDWIGVERDRLQAAYQQKINALVDSLVQAAKWDQVLEWSEHWIRHGHAPESAFRALMKAHAGLGDLSMVRSTYERCVETLERELGVEPSVETRDLFDELTTQSPLLPSSPVFAPTRSTPRRPAFLDEPETIEQEEHAFVAREPELARTR